MDVPFNTHFISSPVYTWMLDHNMTLKKLVNLFWSGSFAGKVSRGLKFISDTDLRGKPNSNANAGRVARCPLCREGRQMCRSRWWMAAAGQLRKRLNPTAVPILTLSCQLMSHAYSDLANIKHGMGNAVIRTVLWVVNFTSQVKQVLPQRCDKQEYFKGNKEKKLHHKL